MAPPTASALPAASATGAPATPAAPTAAAAPPATSGSAPTANGAPPRDDGEPPARFDQTNVYAHDDPTAAAFDVPLFDANGKPLPQTNDRPSSKSASFEARMALLERAIKSGNADDALPAFFPRVAYAQVKDIPEPEKDWEQRLVSAFRRDIAAYRKKLGPELSKSILVDVDVPEAQARFMKPGSEGNRVGYYRVLRSRLTFRLGKGKERTVVITSMISWRGEWYVVHLDGFK